MREKKDSKVKKVKKPFDDGHEGHDHSEEAVVKMTASGRIRTAKLRKRAEKYA